MSRFIIAIIALLFAMQLQAADRVYRWSDAAGRPHFGDHPPADAPSERMQLTSARFAAPPGEARTPQQEIVRLLRAMEADGTLPVAVEEISMHTPDLDDVFFALTGRTDNGKDEPR